VATSLNNLSLRLGDLGRAKDALAAIEEAAQVYRELAARWPDAYDHQLEQSLEVELLTPSMLWSFVLSVGVSNYG
jgi:Tetratricopeptide repeat